jgi:hypothetical protein
MKGKMKMLYQAVGVLGVAMLLSAASSCSRAVVPIENISNAEMAISNAKERNAMIHAPLELRLAEDKLKDANTALEEEEYEKARRLADEAMIGGKLAEEKSQSKSTMKDAEKLRESIETLRQEIERTRKLK